jgi:hypothetical protein
MRSALWLPCLLLPTVALADSTVPAQSGAGCERLPSAWKLDAMVAAAGARDDAHPPKAQLLAWQIDEDERPLRVESALLWIESPGKRWMLAHLYRHPLEKPAEWHISMVTDVPYVGVQSYAAAPRHKAVEAFLNATWWSFRPLGGFRSLGAEVCRDAWLHAFGEAPWHAYPTK